MTVHHIWPAMGFGVHQIEADGALWCGMEAATTKDGVIVLKAYFREKNRLETGWSSRILVHHGVRNREVPQEVIEYFSQIFAKRQAEAAVRLSADATRAQEEAEQFREASEGRAVKVDGP